MAQYSRKNKTLFIGTDSKGIIIIQENRVTAFKNTAEDIRERNAYYSQVELDNGNVLTNESHVVGPYKNAAVDHPHKRKIGVFPFLRMEIPFSGMYDIRRSKNQRTPPV